MPNYPINHHLYTYLWNKYRPAIVKLMSDAQEGPQQYKFLPHEFKDVNPKEKGGYAFVMEVYKGKAQNNIKGSVVAQDLLMILQKSGRALELLDNSIYEFALDKQFILNVKQEPVVEEEEVSEDPTTETTAEMEESELQGASDEMTDEKSDEVSESEEEKEEEVVTDEKKG